VKLDHPDVLTSGFSLDEPHDVILKWDATAVVVEVHAELQMQIEHLTGRRAMHLAQVPALAEARQVESRALPSATRCSPRIRGPDS
jgi:hypothetical protein